MDAKEEEEDNFVFLPPQLLARSLAEGQFIRDNMRKKDWAFVKFCISAVHRLKDWRQESKSRAYPRVIEYISILFQSAS